MHAALELDGVAMHAALEFDRVAMHAAHGLQRVAVRLIGTGALARSRRGRGMLGELAHLLQPLRFESFVLKTQAKLFSLMEAPRRIGGEHDHAEHNESGTP